MTPAPADHPSKQQRFPGEIIRHAVWRSCRLPLSHRDVAALRLVRGVIVSYAASRTWCRKFGPADANALRRRPPHPGDKWH